MVAALLASGSVLAATTAGSDYASITVKGEVTSGTCKIAVNGGSDVRLESIEKTAFIADDTVYSAKPVPITFSDCDPTVTSGTISFVQDGTSIDQQTGYLVNAYHGTDAAQSVEIALNGADGTLLDLNTAAGIPVTIDATGHNGNVTLSAGYITTDKSAVTVGPVDGYVRFSVDYI